MSPTYYATGSYIMEPVLTGRGFSEIPDDAIGIGAKVNNNPLEYILTTNAVLLLQIAEKNDIMMRMTQDKQHGHRDPVYLGAIVSADRQTIYWVNNTQPLP